MMLKRRTLPAVAINTDKKYAKFAHHTTQQSLSGIYPMVMDKAKK